MATIKDESKKVSRFKRTSKVKEPKIKRSKSADSKTVSNLSDNDLVESSKGIISSGIEYTPNYNDFAPISSTYDMSKYLGGNLEHNDLQRASDISSRISAIFSTKVIGQDRMRTSLIATLIAGGHILIESVPGLAKTTAVQALAAGISGSFARIQCTPDLMPNDIVGTQVYNQATGEFTTQLGPINTNLLLLDEINRSSAKTQSAMLEAMQEKQVTIGDKTYKLPDPFMVLATQNPIEEEGTYTLPEAQMDRFLVKEVITYPTPEQEILMVDNLISGEFEKKNNLIPATIDDILFLRETAKKVYVSPALKHYIVSVIATTRGGGPNPISNLNKLVRVGASPRGTIAFVRMCQALALFQGRSSVIPEDVKELRYSILRHRILRTFDAIADEIHVENIIDQVFQVVPVP